MGVLIDLDEEVGDLADAVAEHLGSTQARVIKMALALLAVDLGVRLELPRKEKEHAG